MSEQNISVPWGRDEVAFTLPRGWHVAGVLSPHAIPPVSDMAAEVRRSLAAPVGSQTLRDIARARPRARVALVIDDGSRPTPVAGILPLVLAELEDAGIARESITLIPATGLHRAMSRDEVAQRAGAPDVPRPRRSADFPAGRDHVPGFLAERPLRYKCRESDTG